MYYCGNGVARADSTDGVTFGNFQGSILAGGPAGCDPTVVRMSDGTYRLYYKVAQQPRQPGEPGGPDAEQHTIHTASSRDGLTFTYERRVIEKRSDGRYVSVPDAVRLSDGRVRVYYVSHDQVKSHVSTDLNGTSFEEEPGQRLPDAVDPDVTRVGEVWVMTYAGPSPGSRPLGEKQRILWATSDDGLIFTARGEVVRSASLNLMNPTLHVTPEGRARVYYWSAESDPTQVWSALSDEPFEPLPPTGATTSSSPATDDGTSPPGAGGTASDVTTTSPPPPPVIDKSPGLPEGLALLAVTAMAWRLRAGRAR